jgi:hypothetical protein
MAPRALVHPHAQSLPCRRNLRRVDEEIERTINAERETINRLSRVHRFAFSVGHFLPSLIHEQVFLLTFFA